MHASRAAAPEIALVEAGRGAEATAAVAAGTGKRLFNGQETTTLHLADTVTTSTGVVVVTYTRADAASAG